MKPGFISKKNSVLFLIFLMVFIFPQTFLYSADEGSQDEEVSLDVKKPEKIKETAKVNQNPPATKGKLVKSYESSISETESAPKDKKAAPSVDASKSVLQGSIVKPEKSYIYNSIMPRPINGRELPLGYQPVPYQHTFTPEGLRAEPPGFLPTPRGYYEKEPGRLEPTRGYSENPPDFIEKDSHPEANNSERLRIETDKHPVANLNPSLRIPNEDRPEANKDPKLRISRDAE